MLIVPVPACLYPRALRVTLRVTLAHPQFRQRLQTTVRSHEMRSHEMRPAAPAHSDARSFRCQIIQMTLRVTLRVLAMLLAMLLERCMRRCVRVTMNADR